MNRCCCTLGAECCSLPGSREGRGAAGGSQVYSYHNTVISFITGKKKEEKKKNFCEVHYHPTDKMLQAAAKDYIWGRLRTNVSNTGLEWYHIQSFGSLTNVTCIFLNRKWKVESLFGLKNVGHQCKVYSFEVKDLKDFQRANQKLSSFLTKGFILADISRSVYQRSMRPSSNDRRYSRQLGS